MRRRGPQSCSPPSRSSPRSASPRGSRSDDGRPGGCIRRARIVYTRIMVDEETGGFADAVRTQLRRSLSWLLPLAVLAVALLLKASNAFGLASSARGFFLSLILRAVYGAPEAELRRPLMADATELLFLAIAGVIMAVLFARRSAFAA